MIIDQFIAKWNGKACDFDGSYGNQCVDLARMYWKEVSAISQPRSVAGAKDFWTNYETDSNLNKNFTKVANTPSGFPKKGDIIIWGASYGPYGHIAIASENGTTSQFRAFSQNDPTGVLPAIKLYTYKGVLGWFTPTVSVTQEPMTDDLQKILSHYKVKSGDELIAMVDEQLKFLADERAKTKGLEQTIKDLSDKYNNFVQKLLGILNPFGNPLGLSDGELVIQQTTELVKSTSDLQSKLTEQEKSAQKAEALLVEENQSLQKKLDKLQQQLDDMKVKHETEIATMQKRIDSISQSVDQHEAKQDQFATFRAFIDSIIKLVKGQ